MAGESKVERYLVKRAKDFGGRADKYKTPARRNTPDRILLFPFRVWAFVETKAPGEKPRPGQVREFNRLRAMGYTVHVVDSMLAAELVVHDLADKVKAKAARSQAKFFK